MSKPTSTISSAVSIRVSNTLLDSVREYAIAHNLINNSGRPDKRGEPNLSQAFSELVRLGLGQEITVSDSVSNSTNDNLRNTVDNLSDSTVTLSDRLSNLEAITSTIAPLLARIEALENTRSETVAPAKKAPDAIPESEGDNNIEITGNSLETETLPILDTIESIAIEKPLPDETWKDTIAASKKSKITYRLNNDGSVVLRSLRGITDKQLKRMSDDELRAIGLFKTLRGKDEKFFPNDETLELRYQEKSKPSAATAKPKSKSILTRPEALAIAQNFGFNGTGQNLYDWAKAALTAKSDESRLANSEKLAAVGLVAVLSPEKKPAWQAN